MSQLIAPHGGHLVDGLVAAEEAARLKQLSASLPSWDLTPRQMCDLEMLLNGAFSPLRGFMLRSDYESVRDTMRLASGELWPMPITLDISREFADSLGSATRIALRDPEGVVLAILDIEDRFEPDLELEAKQVFGTTDRKHPSVSHLLERSHPIYLGGRLHGLEMPRHYDFGHLRSTPREVRAFFSKMGWSRIAIA